MNTWLLYGALCVLTVGTLYLYYGHDMPAIRTETSAETKQISVGDALLTVEVADTAEKQLRGLSGTDRLSPDSGMLFVFNEDSEWGIWMKDMRFSIDIVWMDAAGKVLTIAPNVSPDTYPQAFYPMAPARYVLELPAGYVQTHHIAEGTKIVL